MKNNTWAKRIENVVAKAVENIQNDKITCKEKVKDDTLRKFNSENYSDRENKKKWNRKTEQNKIKCPWHIERKEIKK